MRPLACAAAVLAAALTLALPVNHALAGVLTDSAATAVYLAPGKAAAALGVSLPGTGDGASAALLAVAGVALFAVAAAVGLRGKRSPMRSSLALAVAVLGVAATLFAGTSLAFAGGENGVFTATSEITATYDADGSISVPDVELKNETGSAVVLEGAKVVSDYGFVSGWTSDAAGKTVEPGKTLTIKWAANSKLPADWKKGEKVRVGTVAYSYVTDDSAKDTDKGGADDKADGKTDDADDKGDGSAKAIDFSKVGLSTTEFTYDGKAKTPAITGLDGLVEGTDYKVEYRDNVDAGTATATVTGIGSHTGFKTLEFTIDPQAIDAGALKLAEDMLTYDGEAHEPAVEGVPEGLEQGTDYDVTYSDSVNAGTAKATVKFKGNYTGSATLSFEVERAKVSVAANDATKVYGEKDPTFTATVSGLVAGEDEGLVEYAVSRSNVDVEDAGEYEAAIVPAGDAVQGNYEVSYAAGNFKIGPKTVTVTWKPKGDAEYTYDGEKHSPTATIGGAVGSDELAPVYAYKVSEGEGLEGAPTDAGAYTVTVEGFSSKGDAASNYALPTELDVGLSKSFTIKFELGGFWFAAADASYSDLDNAVSDGKGGTKADVVYKSEAEIKADVAKIKAGDAAVIGEYEKIMEKGEYHLYTKWNGSDVTDANSKDKYVEFRIIQVGAHDKDGSALTFAATHSLPTAQQMNSERTNAGGWASSAMRKTVFGDDGYVQAGLSGLKDAAIEVSKAAASDSTGQWKVSATSDKFWLLSNSEVFGDSSEANTLIGDGSFKVEGPQYDWFKAKGVNAKDDWSTVNSAIEDMWKTRSGSRPAGYYSTFWWLRSPYVGISYLFGGVNSDGRPGVSHVCNACSVVPAFSM